MSNHSDADVAGDVDDDEVALLFRHCCCCGGGYGYYLLLRCGDPMAPACLFLLSDDL